jgi:hypothetical protein
LNYFFFEAVFDVLDVFEAALVFVVMEDSVVPLFFGAGATFSTEAGFEARFRFEAAGFAFAEDTALEAAVLIAAVLTDLGRGSVFSAVEAETGSGAGAGLDAACFAASRQFGKNNSMRWREMELARRQRGQCASWWFWCLSSMVINAESISGRPTVKGVWQYRQRRFSMKLSLLKKS